MTNRTPGPPPPNPVYLSIAEVARLVAVSRWTIRREIDEGRLCAVRIRDTVRIPTGAVERWLISLPAVASKPIAREFRPSRPLGRSRKLGLKGGMMPAQLEYQMEGLALDILNRIAERREELVEHAHQHVGTWFQTETGKKHQRRFYAPHVRITNTSADKESVSIYWTRCWPVNHWKGGAAGIEVASKYLAANRRGPAYPASKFFEARPNELSDILEMEAALAPIRIELAFLGRTRSSIASFYTRLAPPKLVSEFNDESLPFW